MYEIAAEIRLRLLVRQQEGDTMVYTIDVDPEYPFTYREGAPTFTVQLIRNANGLVSGYCLNNLNFETLAEVHRHIIDCIKAEIGGSPSTLICIGCNDPVTLCTCDQETTMKVYMSGGVRQTKTQLPSIKVVLNDR